MLPDINPTNAGSVAFVLDFGDAPESTELELYEMYVVDMALRTQTVTLFVTGSGGIGKIASIHIFADEGEYPARWQCGPTLSEWSGGQWVGHGDPTRRPVSTLPTEHHTGVDFGILSAAFPQFSNTHPRVIQSAVFATGHEVITGVSCVGSLPSVIGQVRSPKIAPPRVSAYVPIYGHSSAHLHSNYRFPAGWNVDQVSRSDANIKVGRIITDIAGGTGFSDAGAQITDLSPTVSFTNPTAAAAQQLWAQVASIVLGAVIGTAASTLVLPWTTPMAHSRRRPIRPRGRLRHQTRRTG